MATTSITIYPEAVLTWRGVSVYPTYKYDDYDQGPSSYYFSTSQDGGEDDAYEFDVRELCVPAVALLEQFKPMYKTGATYQDYSGAEKEELDRQWEYYHDFVAPTLTRIALKQAIGDELLDLPAHVEYRRWSYYPDTDNKQRAMVVELMLQLFTTFTGAEEDDRLADMLCDMRHWIDAQPENQGDWDDAIDRSRNHYVAEIEEQNELDSQH